MKVFYLYLTGAVNSTCGLDTDTETEILVDKKMRDNLTDLTALTGVNPAGDAGDTSHPIFWLGGGRQWEYPHQYYNVLSDIADQY